MGKKALLHIGTGKTGTTTIQKQLWEWRSDLTRKGVLYPSLPNDASHNPLVILYANVEHLPRGLKQLYLHEPERLQVDRESYRADFSRALRSGQNLILSGEFFSILGIEEIEDLHNDLEQAGYRDITILMYVREPASYYLSFVQQSLKASSSFVEPGKFRYSFVDTISKWEEVFPGCLQVRAYNSPLSNKTDVLEDAVRVIESVFAVTCSHLQRFPFRANESLSAEAMAILQRYRSVHHAARDNITTEDTNLLLNFLGDLPGSIPTNKAMLRADVASLIRRSHASDIQFLQHYGVSFGPTSETNGRSGRSDGIDTLSRVEEILETVNPASIMDILCYVMGVILRPTALSRPL